jgi:hypothetical protein
MEAESAGSGGDPNGLDNAPGGALGWLGRVANFQVSISALIEVGVWLAVPYLCIGVVWSLFHPEQVARIQTRLESVVPTGADVGAFGLTTALWPASIQIADACPAP